MLVAAVIVVPFFQAARLGAVPGFLISGVIVGPSVLGLIDNVSEISHLAEFGVVLLLFVIGIELKPSRLWLMRKMVFGLGSLQIILTGFVIALVLYFAFNISLRSAILMGPALALSSTAFVLQILTEQKLLTSLYGRTSISILLMQDLAVVPLLALVPLLAFTELSIGEDIGLALIQSLMILGIVVLAGRYLLHPILHRVALSGNPEIFTASAVLIVLGTALATEHAGLSMAMGAFLAGLLISDSFYRHQIIAEIQPFRGILLGLFFMSMGMSLNINLLFENPLASILLVILLLLIKALILIPLSILFGLKTKIATAVALLLAQSGEFALVLFSLAYQSQVISDHLFQQLLLVVLLSMIATPVLAQYARKLAAQNKPTGADKMETPAKAPIVLAGFGRVGHRIGEILSHAGHPFVALDSDAQVVEDERTRGHPVYFGDVRKPEILRAAGACDAKIIIVTLNDPLATEEVVVSLRATYPGINIYARGNTLNDCRKLRNYGATGAVSENIEASLELTRMALNDIDPGNKQNEDLIQDFKKTYQAQIDQITSLED